MQSYTIYLFLWNALHVSGGSSAHQQELKNCMYRTGHFVKQFDKVSDAVHIVFELLMMGGGTAWNMQSISQK
jgi:hypothetical protein